MSSAKVQTLDGKPIATGWIELGDESTLHLFLPETDKCVWDLKSHAEVVAIKEDGQEVRLYRWERCQEPKGLPVIHFHYTLQN